MRRLLGGAVIVGLDVALAVTLWVFAAWADRQEDLFYEPEVL